MHRLFEKKVIPSHKNGSIMLERVWGKTIVRVDGVQQSGGGVNAIWRYSLEKIWRTIPHNAEVLMLGLGAGGAIKDINRLFPACTITAVEYDPQMITLAHELTLRHTRDKPTILEGDAAEVLPQLEKQFDLIMVDLFNGAVASPLLLDEVFLLHLKHRTAPHGMVLINAFLEPEKLRLAEDTFRHSARWLYATNTIGALWDYEQQRE